jgi:hypothetical protein
VSEPAQPAPADAGFDAVAGETERIDALPVLASVPQVARRQATARTLPDQRRFAGTVMPAVQAAAVAAGGFVAGAAVVGLVHRHNQRSAALVRGRRGARRLGKSGESMQVVGSRSFLLDVHLLGGSGGNR